MKHIVISRKPDSQNREAQARKLFAEIQHKTPAQLMEDDDQAIILDDSKFETALPEDALLIITLSEDEKWTKI